MISDKRLGIIIPSFNDNRIADAIESIRRFDDISCVKLFVIDGGSSTEVCNIIRPLMREGDVFIHEHDRGIFDALNKGLDLSDTEFIGWLGSDDLLTGQVLASDVVHALETHDLFVASLAMFNDQRVVRLTHSLPSRFALARFGLHNPHYSTFGRALLLQSERFEMGLLASDISYFLKIFARKPQVATTGKVATLQGQGGFSNKTIGRSVHVNMQLLPTYSRHANILVAPLALAIKLGYKTWSIGYYKIFKTARASLEKHRNPTTRNP